LGWFSAKLWYGDRVLSQRRKGPDVRILIYLICFKIALVFGAETPNKAVQNPAEAKAGQKLENARAPLANPGIASSQLDDLILLERKSRNLPSIEAVPDEAAIAKLTSRILMQMHYLHCSSRWTTGFPRSSWTVTSNGSTTCTSTSFSPISRSSSSIARLWMT